MSNQLYMDVQAANAVVHEMDAYLSDSNASHLNSITNPLRSLHGTWVSRAYYEFSDVMGELVVTCANQQNELMNLISRLKKEIREWEETSRSLGG